MILVWGLPEDPPTALVVRALAELGAPHVFVNHGDVERTELELEQGARVTGTLATVDGDVGIEDVDAMYLRPYDFRAFPALAAQGPASPAWQHAQRLDELLWGWADVADAVVLNRPSAMLSNGSKPYQARLIAAAGFDVPRTLITTDRAAVERFAAGGRVIYKSISGTRSIVHALAAEQAARLDDVRWCPTQFQELVAGVEHRVHVVGDRWFACRIESDAIDYRYAPAAYAACELPDDVGRRCVALARALGLVLCGIDLRQRPDGGWTCFEVNPSPAYSCYEKVTGQPIGGAIAEVLARAVRPRARGPAVQRTASATSSRAARRSRVRQ